MKAAVFSDTHACISLMLEAVRRLRPDILIHLGDYERDADELRKEFPDKPLFSVCGNCDICHFSPETDIVPLGSVKAFITHGHLYNVDWGRMDSLVYAAMENGCKIAMFGHTHSPEYCEIGGITVLNPGSSGKGRSPSYAVVEVGENGCISAEILKL